MRLPDLNVINITISEDLVIRPYVLGDTQALFETVKRNEKHLISFMQWMTPDYSIEMASDFVKLSVENAEKKVSLNLGIFRGHKLIGSTGYVYFDTKIGKTEIGYWIDKAEEGKGIISLTTANLIDLAFNEFEMNRIELRCSTLNKRSALIAKRFGFVQEANLRQSEIIHGQLHDFFIFGLLKNEWKN